MSEQKTAEKARKQQAATGGSIKHSILKGIYLSGLKLRPLLKKVTPESVKKIFRYLEARVIRSSYPKEISNHTSNLTNSGLSSGINLIGYARAEMGIGESCRIAANALQTTGIPFGVINFAAGNPARMNDLSWKHKEMTEPLYKTNIFHINAEQMPLVYLHMGADLFRGKFNIGVWHWELPDFPDEWCDSFKFVQEVWVPSTFVQESISTKSPVPVVRIPHAIEVKYPQDIQREFFRLPANCFLFLSMYDIHSVQERKNPQAVVHAFRNAFGQNDPYVGLVLKVNNATGNKLEVEQLRETVSQNTNIYLIDDFLSRKEVNAVLNCTDCYISLHRSEGFGLGLAEAMYLGKPVIGTNWSGNTDFMNSANSCPVNYKLKNIDADYGPYKAYQVWANPDIEHAAYFMRKLVSDEHWRQMIAINGQRTIRNDFSPAVVGEIMKRRLNDLGLL